MMPARPYQREAIRKIAAYAAENPYGRLILVLPTRSGKTFVAAMIVLQMVVRQGFRALWLVHREELLDEAVRHLIEVGVPRAQVGVIKAGRAANPEAAIQVASDATLERRDRPVAHFIVTDEAHRDTSARRRKIRRAYPKAFQLGLTATPKAPHQRDLGEDYDAMLVVVQPSELIHDGWLSAPTVFAPSANARPDLRGVRIYKGDYHVADLEPRLTRRKLLDDQVREWARLAEGRATIAFPVSRAHSIALVERFRAAGIDAHHLEGATPGQERRTVLAGLASGKIPVVSSVGVLIEGTNIPRVKLAFCLRPTRSLPLWIQSSMRCATPWEGVRPRILDAPGNVFELGFPFSDRHWSLINAQSGRVMNGNGKVKRCGVCGAVMPDDAAVCSSCTAVFPEPEVPDAPAIELHEVTLDEQRREEERQRLLAYAQRQRFQDPEGWAARVLRLQHGAAA